MEEPGMVGGWWVETGSSRLARDEQVSCYSSQDENPIRPQRRTALS